MAPEMITQVEVDARYQAPVDARAEVDARYQAEVDARYQAEGWKKVQIGELVMYQKPLPDAVIEEVKKVDQVRKSQPLWRRILKKIILLNL